MRVSGEEAYVLHHREYGETSLLLEMFTRQHGRLGLMAKGARRPRSPLRLALIPFQPLLVSFSGRGDLPTVSSAEPGNGALPLSGKALVCGLYLNELLLRLLHRHDPHERLFESYIGTLTQLSSTTFPEQALRIFEKHLLNEIGYGMVLDHDVGSGLPIDPLVLYRYQPEHGPVIERDSGGEGIAIHGASLLALAHEVLNDEQSRREAKRLLRALLARQLGDRPLTSRNLFSLPRPADALE
ncbi:MAG: DNA repair protein RecO [Gammaproteobacteria bacterium]|nr:DNA repair protein RecO [Gammaproteobacteria bacterium]